MFWVSEKTPGSNRCWTRARGWPRIGIQHFIELIRIPSTKENWDILRPDLLRCCLAAALPTVPPTQRLGATLSDAPMLVPRGPRWHGRWPSSDFQTWHDLTHFLRSGMRSGIFGSDCDWRRFSAAVFKLYTWSKFVSPTKTWVFIFRVFFFIGFPLSWCFTSWRFHVLNKQDSTRSSEFQSAWPGVAVPPLQVGDK